MSDIDPYLVWERFYWTDDMVQSHVKFCKLVEES